MAAKMLALAASGAARALTVKLSTRKLSTKTGAPGAKRCLGIGDANKLHDNVAQASLGEHLLTVLGLMPLVAICGNDRRARANAAKASAPSEAAAPPSSSAAAVGDASIEPDVPSRTTPAATSGAAAAAASTAPTAASATDNDINIRTDAKIVREENK
jgi:hypothetical protein